MVKGVDAYAQFVVMCIDMRKQIQSEPDTEHDKISEADESVNDEASAILSDTCRQHTDFLKSGGGHGRSSREVAGEMSS
jgi:dsDNA-specific endonuclease/ATPase MutS2